MTASTGDGYFAPDGEFYGPEGFGCSHCHVRPPVVFGLRFNKATIALCDDCLMVWFPGWAWARVVDWLGSQRSVYLRHEAFRVLMLARRKATTIDEADALTAQYHEKYPPREWWS